MKHQISSVELNILERLKNTLLLSNNKIYVVTDFEIGKETKRKFLGGTKEAVYLTKIKVLAYNSSEDFIGVGRDEDFLFHIHFQIRRLSEWRHNYINLKRQLELLNFKIVKINDNKEDKG